MADGRDTESILQITPEWLASLGYAELAPAQSLVVMRRAYSALERMVGTLLVQEIRSDELDEFEAYVGTSNDAAAMEFVRQNAPDYAEVVRMAFNSLEDALRSAAQHYLQSSSEVDREIN